MGWGRNPLPSQGDNNLLWEDKSMKTFTINGKKYKAKELTYSDFREMESFGLNLMTDITSISAKTLSYISGYLAVCGGFGIEVADNEMNEHIINGGDFTEISEAFGESLNESRFFQAVVNNATKNTETKKTVSKKA
jgi:hypothetical protein